MPKKKDVKFLTDLELDLLAHRDGFAVIIIFLVGELAAQKLHVLFPVLEFNFRTPNVHQGQALLDAHFIIFSFITALENNRAKQN